LFIETVKLNSSTLERLIAPLATATERSSRLQYETGKQR
jgi:hypothetical protein